MMNLTSKHFAEAVKRHLDRFKFDPLIMNQLKSLDWTWTDRTDDAKATHSSMGLTQLHQGGSLQIANDYCIVEILASCSFSCSSHTSDSDSEQHDMSFRLTITHVEFSSQKRSRDDIHNNNNNSSQKWQKVESKIHSDMVQRLKQNIHIQNLIRDIDSSKEVLLCESHVQLHTSSSSSSSKSAAKNIIHQEQRYEVQSHVLNALHVGLFSLMDGGTIDVLRLLLDLPWLPRTSIFSWLPGSVSCPIINQLGDKAVLRLLEDLLVDECDQINEDDDDDDDDNASDDETVEQIETLCIKDDPGHERKRIKS